MPCVAAKMSLGLVIAAPDAAEKFGGSRPTEDLAVPFRVGEHRVNSKAAEADLDGHNLYKRSHAAGGQREVRS